MPDREGSLRGRHALITGASSGIGTAIATAIASAGADVALVGRDARRTQAAAESVQQAGGRVVAITADLTQDGAAAQVVDQTAAELGGLDALVNAAGIFEVAAFTDSLENLDRQWRTNVRAPFALTAAAMPHLRQRPGAVVFMSSIGGRIGFPMGSSYCATKGAIDALVLTLAVEEAPNGVRVNAIAPGNVRTSMNDELLQDPTYERTMLAQTPLGRIGTTADIAPAAVFLLSDAASYMTGSTMVIDGGWLAQ